MEKKRDFSWLRMAIEDAGTNMEVLKTLEHASKALKSANLGMDLDKVGLSPGRGSCR